MNAILIHGNEEIDVLYSWSIEMYYMLDVSNLNCEQGLF